MNIFKYLIGTHHKQSIEIPSEYHILDIQIQNGFPVLWAMVNPESEKTTLNLIVYGTGWNIVHDTNKYYFVRTVQAQGFVWHYFAEFINTGGH